MRYDHDINPSPHIAALEDLDQTTGLPLPLPGIGDLSVSPRDYSSSRENSILYSSRLQDKRLSPGGPHDGLKLDGLLTISTKALNSRERSNLGCVPTSRMLLCPFPPVPVFFPVFFPVKKKIQKTKQKNSYLLLFFFTKVNIFYSLFVKKKKNAYETGPRLCLNFRVFSPDLSSISGTGNVGSVHE